MNNKQAISKNYPIGLRRFFPSASLQNRLILAFVLLAILPVLITGIAASIISANGLRAEAFNRLDAVSSQKENEIKTLLKVLQTNLTLVSEDSETQKTILTLLQGLSEGEVDKEPARRDLISFIEKTGYFTEVFILNDEGMIVLSTNETQEEKLQGNQEYFIRGFDASYVTPPTYEVALANYSIVISQPIKNQFGRTVGVLAGRVNLSTLNEIMQQRSGLGETAELYLVSSNFAVLTKLNHGDLVLGETYIRTEGVTDAVRNKASGSAVYTDYTGNIVLGVYHWIPELQIALIAENDQNEALQAATSVFQTTLTLIIFTIIVAIFLSILITRGITQPITNLVHVAENIAQGNLSLRASVSQNDEIGALAKSFNYMTDQLFQTLSSLEQRVVDRTRALATSTEVSRRISTILDERKLVTEVVEQIQAAYNYYHGQIYLLDKSGQTLVLAGATGEGGNALLEKKHSISIERGLVGRAARTKSSVLVPDTSKDPEWVPNPLLPDTKAEIAVPILLGDELLGVIDMQDDIVGDIYPEDIEYLTAIANQVAIALQNSRSFSQARQKAERESLILSISQKIQSEATVDSALQVTVREIGRALGANVRVKLKSNNGEK
ncbi:MAG TPA: GAF domain-containing protein [Anaerolineales bacterium]|nr:GAF domain-containing protein [Anaerolineales bacterium]HNB34917.1 GAF domain-containing protein [Anaerolineales bacterium]